jgi:hypothetical protein
MHQGQNNDFMDHVRRLREFVPKKEEVTGGWIKLHNEELRVKT